MNLYNKFVSIVTEKLSEGQDSARYEILYYGVEVLISSIFTLLLLMIISLILGVFKETMAIAAVCIILRQFTGGMHSKSLLGCTIITIIILSLLGLFVKYFQISINSTIVLTLFAFIFAFYSFYKFVPVDCEEKPVTSINQRQKLKKRSLMFLIILLLIQVIVVLSTSQSFNLQIAIPAAVLWQALQLTFAGQIIARVVDRCLDFKKGGECS